MPNDSSTNDPKTIWQNQSTEPSKMTLVLIQQKTQQLHTKTRHELLTGVALSLFIATISVFGIWWVHGVALRAVFALAIVWTLAAHYFVNRESRSDSASSEVSLNTTLQSYRREVERQRYLSSRFLVWSFGPAVLAVSALSVHLLAIAWTHGYLRKTVPFFTLLGVWFVVVFVIRMRQQRNLQREIEQLNEVERSNNL